jgi:hypothetical protein
MSEPTLKGSCLCNAVRYEIRPPFMRFYHCYCSRCRKATGTARGTNIAVALRQFKWISGEDLIHRYDLPEARSFSTAVCTRCNCPVPKPTRAREHMIVPSGSLDDPPPTGPSAHRQWESRVSWAAIDESHLPVSE